MTSLPEDLRRLLRRVPALRRAYLVGGCVRDGLLGLAVKDFDLEVYGVSYAQLAEALRPYGRVELVGRSFGVIKLTLDGATHDFSVPRRDSKRGQGHRGFEVELDPNLDPAEACARRDFTINALMQDPRTGKILDFHGGRADLEARVLRHTSQAFVEDPLRVLRGMQFAARFRLAAAPETLALCQSMLSTYAELAGDRVRDEWFKWAARAEEPSAGLRFLEGSGWIAHFPELAALRAIPQDPEWHPEGDVLTHTQHCLDALVRDPEWQAAEETTRIVLSLAVLAHDFGKACTTQTVLRQGVPRIVSPGHELESGKLAENFLHGIHAPHAIVDRVVPLVVNHMAHFQDPTARMVRRLARRLHPETVERLCVLMSADAAGRPPRPTTVPAGVVAMRQLAQEMKIADAAPQPLLRGRHLLGLGLSAGPEVGQWSRLAFEAQLDGAFQDLAGGFAWLSTHPAWPDHLRGVVQTAAQNGSSAAASGSASPPAVEGQPPPAAP